MHPLSKFKTLLVLNGNIPGRAFFDQFQDICVVGVDGGASKILDLGILPHIIIGDLDGFDKSLISNTKTEIVYAMDQDFTDFEKAIMHVADKKLFPALVLGMNGGEIDHILNNMHVFIRYSEKYDMSFYDEGKIGTCIHASGEMDLKPGSNVSLFSFSEDPLSTSGLEWELKNEPLYFLKRSGVRNRAKSSKVSFAIPKKSSLLVIS